MTAANYIGYFAHMIDTGKMTEEEANKRLREMFEADIQADEFDRKTFELIKNKNPALCVNAPKLPTKMGYSG